MQTTQLGNTTISVNALGIGTWAWGDKLFWGYGDQYGSEQVKAAFNATLDAGVTFFDTAEVYGFGESESLLGQFIKERGQPVDIATKYGPAPWRLGSDAVKDAVAGSLKRLQLSRITLYQVHWPFTFLMSQDTLLNALADEVQAGRIGAIGVSNYDAKQMREAHAILAKRDIPLAVNQVQYSLLHRHIERNGILQTARELNLTILAYSPLAQGLLTGKYDPKNPPQPEGMRRFDSRFSRQGLQKIAPVLNQLTQLGEKYGKTPAQVALNWLIAQGNVIPIPGAKNAKQATQNTGALNWHLAPEEVQQLDKVTQAW